jgi:DNA invertase Pin-like site-specific DNA recombinase
MASGKFVAYYRVSTDKQGKSGLGLEAQRAAVMGYLNGGAWELVEAFTEVESGKRNDRPQLAAALAAAKKAKATLIIAKLDRLARNVAFVAGVMESGVDFIAVDNPHANKLTVHILAAVAEHEREMISARTKDALAAAKARGTVLGNKTNLNEARAKSEATRRARAEQGVANVLPVMRQIQAAGATTLRDIAAALNARGITTARGAGWDAKAVKRVLDRAA